MFAKIRRFLNNGDVSRFRFWIQILTFGVFVYGGYLAIDIGMDIPTFACPYNDNSAGSCFFMGLQHRLVLSFDNFISFRGLGIITAIGSFFVWFVFFNKAWCGFACPLGTLQDWITRIREFTGTSYERYNKHSFQRLKKIKYFLLGLMILIPLGIANAIPGLAPLSHDWGTPFCMICPGRTILPLLNGDTSQLAIDFSSTTKLVFTTLGMMVTGLFFTGAFFKKRFFCFFCPMSAFHHIFSRAGMLRLVKDGKTCTKCGDCYRACDMGIHEIADDTQSTFMIKDDCMLCFDCVAACPENGTLKAKFIKWSVYESTEEGFFKRFHKKVRNHE